MTRQEFYEKWGKSEAVQYLFENNTLPTGAPLDTGVCCDILIAEATARIKEEEGDAYYKFSSETPWESIIADVKTFEMFAEQTE